MKAHVRTKASANTTIFWSWTFCVVISIASSSTSFRMTSSIPALRWSMISAIPCGEVRKNSCARDGGRREIG